MHSNKLIADSMFVLYQGSPYEPSIQTVMQELARGQEQIEKMEKSFDQALKEAKITESKLLGDLAERSLKYEKGLSDLKMNYENKITSLYAEIDDVTK